MAQAKKEQPKTVTMYSPKGTKVTVTEEQSKKLRGYTSSKSGTTKQS